MASRRRRARPPIEIPAATTTAAVASFNFGLLDLADGESGEAAVSVVVSKAKKAEATQAKKAEADGAESSGAAATGTDKDKAALKNLYFRKLQYDNGICSILHELKRLREVLIKLRREETKLKEKGENGRHLMQLSEEQRELRLKQLSEEQRKLRQQQKDLRVQEAKLRAPRREFYLEHGFALGADEEETPYQAESVQGNDNASGDDVHGSFNGDGNGCVHYGDGNGSVHCYHDHDGVPDVHADGAYVYHERQVDDYSYDNYGGSGRQGYPEVHNKSKRKVQKYVVKTTQPSSDAGTEADHKLEEEEADHKPEEKVTSDACSEPEHKPVDDQKEAASPANADVAPASGSENSSAEGAVASNNGKDGPRIKKQKQKINGSEKRKRKNAKNGGNEVGKAKKQDSTEADVSKKTDKEPLADNFREEEKTLAEYERIRESKKKSSDETPKSEARKVSVEEFEGLQMLEKKKLDEVVMKAEKVQTKAKETGKKEEKPQPEAKDADDVKPKKVAQVVIPLNELSFAPPRRVVFLEDGSSNGGGAPRGRFSGSGFHGRSRDNSTDSRVPAAVRGSDNGRAGQNEAANYGNGAPRGGYSGGRGRGGYPGRGDGGYSAPRGDYNGGRGDGAQGGGHSGRGNGGGYNNQGGNGGGYQQQQGGFQRRPGNNNNYRPRGRGYSGNGRSTAAASNPIVVEDMSLFPPLSGAAPARAAAPSAAPAQGPAQS